MSSSSSTSVGRRKKKTQRSISDSARDGKKQHNNSTDRARRPEEDDLTDSNRSVICAPPEVETIIKADGGDDDKPTVVAPADHHKQHNTKKSSKRARAKQPQETLRIEEFVFFLGSVQVKDNEEVVELGLSLHDFALHDAVKEVLVLAASNETTMRDVHQMEEFILYGMDGGGGGAGAGGARKGDPYDGSAVISGGGRRPSIKPNGHTKNT